MSTVLPWLGALLSAVLVVLLGRRGRRHAPVGPAPGRRIDAPPPRGEQLDLRAVVGLVVVTLLALAVLLGPGPAALLLLIGASAWAGRARATRRRTTEAVARSVPELVDLFGLAVPKTRLFILALAVVAVVALAVVLKVTPLGRRIRAVVQNRDLAEASGVSTRTTDRLTFFIGSGLAGIAGAGVDLVEPDQCSASRVAHHEQQQDDEQDRDPLEQHPLAHQFLRAPAGKVLLLRHADHALDQHE